LTPRITSFQNLLQWDLKVMPQTGAISSRRDYFGNDVSSFSVLEGHNEFSVVATSVVALDKTPSILSSVTVAETAILTRQAADRDTLAASEFLWESPFVPHLEKLICLSDGLLPPNSELLTAVTKLMQWINQAFRYVPTVTSIETPLEEVIERRQGVCQDFAHVMIGCLRVHGIAARYVSGYLRGNGNFVGDQASHAWVSVYAPSVGWVDFDPTNNLQPDQTHLTLAWGRDYGDVPPVKGTTVGGGGQKLTVAVSVEELA
jgi:transglutaminase-like putative cysteine protease